MYRFVVKNNLGVKIGEFVNVMSVKFGKRLNNYGTCELTMAANDPSIPQLYEARRNTLWIYKDELLVWAGEFGVRKTKYDNKGAGIVVMYAYTWLEQFKARFTIAEKIYTQIDQGAIMWDLIGGDFDIVEGTIEETILRDRTYYSDNKYEALVNMSNVISGLDFEITDNKVFNAQSVIGNDLTDSIVLDYGHNIVDCEIIEDFSNPVNQGIALGQSTEADSLLRVEDDDAGSQTLYGVRQGVSSEMSVSETDTLTEKAEALTRKFRYPLIKVDQTLLPSMPSINEFSLGDLIRLRIQKDFHTIDEEYRIFEWEVEYDKDNNEKVDVVLGKFTL